MPAQTLVNLVRRLNSSMQEARTPYEWVNINCGLHFMLYEEDTCGHCEFYNARADFNTCETDLIYDIMKGIR